MLGLGVVVGAEVVVVVVVDDVVRGLGTVRLLQASVNGMSKQEVLKC